MMISLDVTLKPETGSLLKLNCDVESETISMNFSSTVCVVWGTVHKIALVSNTRGSGETL